MEPFNYFLSTRGGERGYYMSQLDGSLTINRGNLSTTLGRNWTHLFRVTRVCGSLLQPLSISVESVRNVRTCWSALSQVLDPRAQWTKPRKENTPEEREKTARMTWEYPQAYARVVIFFFFFFFWITAPSTIICTRLESFPHMRNGFFGC
jgi:hypothetical protein